ncbi:MAG TPA: polysaccharide biosynthesis/export family protein [Polyangia bacterium]|jgi:polysaccharide export outer membrane protein|nr:polysaccharide biosynthesis/export family protein [Polyangia bacterium]
MFGRFLRASRWLAASSLILVAACAAQPKRTIAAGEVGVPEDRVGIDDTFDVRVYGEGDLTGTFRVATDGTIDYPLAGRVVVAGLRTGEIQQLLVTRLKDRYLRDPQVVVTIKERNSQKISVLGQVSRPGQVSYYPNMTIVDAIASAGGFTGIAAKNSVNLRREVAGKIETHVFPVADISEGRSPNVQVLPGDVLVVDERVF